MLSSRPLLILMSGAPGSGKSTLGRHRPKNGFSVAAIPPLVIGAANVLEGALRLAGRRVPLLLRVPWLVSGPVGISTGLYGLAEARWYTKQMTSAYPTIFFAGASYGIWFVLIGGVVAIMVGLQNLRIRAFLSFSSITVLVAVGAGLLLTPRL